MLIREVLLFMRLEVRTELLLESAEARVRHLSMKGLWPQQLVKRSNDMVIACTSAENRAELETKSLLVHKLQQPRQLNGQALDATENSANGDRGNGQNEKGQQGAAVQTISNPEQGGGGVPKALENPVRAVRWSK